MIAKNRRWIFYATKERWIFFDRSRLRCSRMTSANHMQSAFVSFCTHRFTTATAIFSWTSCFDRLQIRSKSHRPDLVRRCRPRREPRQCSATPDRNGLWSSASSFVFISVRLSVPCLQITRNRKAVETRNFSSNLLETAHLVTRVLFVAMQCVYSG